jgi:hypothetical protein
MREGRTEVQREGCNSEDGSKNEGTVRKINVIGYT